MLQCRACGYGNVGVARFCLKCGTPLRRSGATVRFAGVDGPTIPNVAASSPSHALMIPSQGLLHAAEFLEGIPWGIAMPRAMVIHGQLISVEI